MKKISRASLTALLALAAAVPQVATTEAPSSVQPAQQQTQKEQAPAVPQAQAQAILEQLGGGFHYWRRFAGAGIPWPGRAAARARHHAGSGRRP